MAPDHEWPEAWYLADGTLVDQCQPNRLEPNEPADVDALKQIGICYWNMPDVDKYQYPIISVPWDPSDAKDPKLQALRDDRGYSYADIITVHPDHLVCCEQIVNKIKMRVWTF
jgi:1,2-dihydroxy-3-keto-5-methylthiopentene dioxygenase